MRHLIIDETLASLCNENCLSEFTNCDSSSAQPENEEPAENSYSPKGLGIVSGQNLTEMLQIFQPLIRAVVPVLHGVNGVFCCMCLLFFVAVPLAAETSYESDIRKAAHRDDAEAQYALAILYEYGGTTVQRSPEQAAYWLEKAARKRVAGACLYLGLKYENGNGTPQDHVKAHCWYLCAAQQDWPMAQYLLAELYEKGKGVPHSPVTALAWLDLAREHGYPKAGAEFIRLQQELGLNNLAALEALQKKLLRKPATPCN